MKQLSKKVAKISAAGILSLSLFMGGALAACKTIASVVDIKDVVSVTGGKIQGQYVEDNTVVEYKGIPYAASPTGENRWKAPQDVEAWEGVKDCTKWGNSAYQSEQNASLYWTDEFIISNKVYNEDCLTLNVWTKNEDTIANRPVIVYIHGGAFSGGGSSCEVYEGEDIAKQDVVYVSINYRLGIFGFFANSDLAKEDPNGSSGNYGLMDMIKALQWVQTNIAQFGGDASNVTIMGQSAGACSVNYLSVSPAAKGLFKRAVACSYDDINGAQALISYIDTMESRIETNDAITEGYTLEQLRSMSTEEVSSLLSGGGGAGGGEGGGEGGDQAMPDGNENTADDSATQTAMPNTSENATENATENTSENTSEGTPNSGMGEMPGGGMGEMPGDFGGGGFGGGSSGADAGSPCIDGYIIPKTYGDALVEGALGDIDLMSGFVDNDANDAATGMNAIALDRGLFLSDHDENFTAGESLMATQNAIAKARSLTKDKGSTYIYRFSQVMPGSSDDYAFHTSDIPYFLNHFSSLRSSSWTAADKKVGVIASGYLVNFAKTGNPNGDGLATWTACTGNYTYMDINENSAQKTFTAEKISAVSAYLKASSKVKYPQFY